MMHTFTAVWEPVMLGSGNDLENIKNAFLWLFIILVLIGLFGALIFGLLGSFFEVLLSIILPKRTRRSRLQDSQPYVPSSFVHPHVQTVWRCECGVTNSMRLKHCRSCGRPAVTQEEPAYTQAPPPVANVQQNVQDFSSGRMYENTDELLRQYQDMLDSGLISKEEFEDRKRQLGR